MIRLNWRNKARIMQLCSHLPWGGQLYVCIQKTFGRLKANPISRLPIQAKIAKWILESGREIEDKRFFEVGTGHVPLAPIGFFLCGAGSVITVDLHRRIAWNLVRQSLVWIAAHQNEVRSLYGDIIDEALFDERFDLLCRHQNNPAVFFKEARIEYLAPMDAAHSNLNANSVDCHFSITVLEHIPSPIIRDIFREAKRILKPDGTTIHFVDMSDHFQHTDNSITRINFLRYSEEEWQRIAGNEFAYCNRLRASDYLRLFGALGYTIDCQEISIDRQSIKALEEGNVFLDPIFAEYDLDDICSISLGVKLSTQDTNSSRYE